MKNNEFLSSENFTMQNWEENVENIVKDCVDKVLNYIEANDIKNTEEAINEMINQEILSFDKDEEWDIFRYYGENSPAIYADYMDSYTRFLNRIKEDVESKKASD